MPISPESAPPPRPLALVQHLVGAFEAADDEARVLSLVVEGAAALGMADVAAWRVSEADVARVAAVGILADLEEPPRPGAVDPERPGLVARPCGAPGRRDGIVAAVVDGPDGEERLDLVLSLASSALRRIDRAREAALGAARVAAERLRTRAIVDQSPLIVALRVGPDHVLEMANARYLQMVGADRAIYGKPGRETLPEVAAQGFFDLLDRVYATGEPYTGREVRARFDRAGDGRMVEGWFTYTWAPVRDADGRVVATAMHALDVTEQVEARREAEAARARFRDLVHSIDAIVWEAELDASSWSFVSEWAERVLGYPLRRWYEPGFWRTILHPEDAERVLGHARAASRRGLDYEVEYRVVAMDGRPVWMRDTVRVQRDPDGRPARLRGVMVDVTARKEAEGERDRIHAQLLHTQKLESLGVLAGGVAHDFNNLLAVVLGKASYALVSAQAAGTPTGPLEDIVVAARRAQNLTRQLLAYAGKAPFRCERLDLSATVGELLGLVETAISKKVELAVSFATDLPAVEGDPAQIQQVVLNLVLNAAEAVGDEVGRVGVSTAREELAGDHAAALHVEPGPYVRFEVVDTGVGMGPEVLARVFDPFYSTKGLGRGLGLSAVAGIVRAHGGAIRFASAPGQGTRCAVYLPAREGGATRGGFRSEARRMGRGEGTILVVDDEAEVRSTARLLLEYLGYRVIEAGDGPAAIAVLEDDGAGVTAVLLDLTMPLMGGEETLLRIRERHPWLPVVVSSGYDAAGAMGGLASAGPTAFLQKPYTVHELAASFVDAAEGPEGLRAERRRAAD